MKPVLAADSWATNADLIAEIRHLHFPSPEKALDLTYNTGKWWSVWRPNNLTTNDLGRYPTDLTRDYRTPGWFWDRAAGRYDLVAFDPPYQAQGGRKTSTVPGMNEAYGRDLTAKDPSTNQGWINAGLSTAVKVCAPRGVVLCKVMNYVSSGKLWLGVQRTVEHAETLPVSVEAIYTHVGAPGPQPTHNPDGTLRQQKSPRNNASTLLVLRKDRVKK